MTLFPAVWNLMKEKGLGDVLLTGGGIIPEEDISALEKMGIGKLFGPGTPTKVSIDFVKEWVEKNR
jgi:methylmalonyl-CoA mutase C-terminal domain/subunit